MNKELKALKKFIEKLKADIEKEEKVPAYGYRDNDYKDGMTCGMQLVLEDLERLVYRDFDEDYATIKLALERRESREMCEEENYDFTDPDFPVITLSCPSCHEKVEEDYVCCPHCRQELVRKFK